MKNTLDYDVIIIGVSPDNDKSHSEFRDHMKIPFFLASDSDQQISQKYGVFGLKKFMGKEYLGISRTTFLIDKNGKIVKIFNKVKLVKGLWGCEPDSGGKFIWVNVKKRTAPTHRTVLREQK